MDKVILLSGSPRENSNCEQVLNECKKVIEAEGLEAKIFSLKGKDIHSCIACNSCVETKKCIFNDGINELIKEIKEAKGFIVAAPVYFGTARADVMAALQRIGYISRRDGNFLSWKVGGPVVIGRRGGHTATYQEMLMFYFINEMVVPGANYWNMIFGGPQGKALEDEEGMNTVKIFSKNVAKLIKKL